MATIVDIARETGLARTTVAEVLRGKPGYSLASQELVRETARRLGYRPNFLGKALGGGKSMSVAAIWPLRGVTGDIDVAMAVLEQAQARGYVTYQTEYRPDAAWLRQAMQEFAARRVDALILWSDSIRLRQLLDDLNAFSIVVAVSNEPVEGFAGDLLVHDRYHAIEQAVDHFVLTGRRRPAIVLTANPSEQGKVDAFLRRCRHHGLASDARSVIGVDRSPHPADLVARYRGTLGAHFHGEIDADALLCGTDQGAMVAARFVESRGRRVPEDVAVVGWNDLSTNVLWHPPLASVSRCQEQVIPAMQEMLFTRLEQPGLPPRQRTVPMRFIWRASAGGPGPQIAAANPSAFAGS